MFILWSVKQSNISADLRHHIATFFLFFLLFLFLHPSLSFCLSVTLVHLSPLSPFPVNYLSNFCSFSVQVCHNYPELRPPIMPLAIPSHSVPCYIHILSHTLTYSSTIASALLTSPNVPALLIHNTSVLLLPHDALPLF